MANSTRLEFNGLAELKRALRDLPEDLAGEAQHIVEGAANSAAAEIKHGYPVKTGHLRDGLTVTHFESGKVAAGAIVKNRAKHSHLFEFGTHRRHNAKGANRGTMPAAHKFVPIAIKARRRMYGLLADMLRRHGFTVGQ